MVLQDSRTSENPGSIWSLLQGAQEQSLAGNKYVHPSHRIRDCGPWQTQASQCPTQQLKWFTVQSRINPWPTRKLYPLHAGSSLGPLSIPLRRENPKASLCGGHIYHINSQDSPGRHSSPHFLDEETKARTEPAWRFPSCVFSPYSCQAH